MNERPPDSSEVVIKGEVHTSRGDFDEERNLLAEGVDTLIIEGQREQAELGWLHGWFGIAMLIFEHLFAHFLYTDQQMLVDIAEGQGAEIRYTRDSDADLLRNSHALVVALAFASFYFLIFLSAVFGLLLDNQVNGAACLVGSGLVPILLLRVHETVKVKGNRDQKIAEKITKAANPGDRVVAVLGHQHAKNVPQYLPGHLDPEARPPLYGTFSLKMVRDLAPATIRLCGTLAVVYPAFLGAVEIWFSLVG
jgi:hypothetical protein